ncbi:MAG: type III pantothenate kinase [Lachnospiraceae bacterium]|nr:type III pantothenate kinase [Lachnospiraceae bacterium]
MLLAIDMGNTNIEVGLMDGEHQIFSERLFTDLKKTETEYAVLLHTIFEIRNIEESVVDGAIISSVVPPLTHIMEVAILKSFGVQPLIVGPGVKNGLKIRIEEPKTLGADLVVDSVGAIELYGAPVIVIDMGTATTIVAIDKERNYLGGVVVAGVGVSLNALSTGTSLLPRIALDPPKSVIGSNTADAMRAGIIYGQAAMIDGIVDRMFTELGYETKIVATGGLSNMIIPHCSHEITIDGELMIKGLKIIYDRNQ